MIKFLLILLLFISCSTTIPNPTPEISKEQALVLKQDIIDRGLWLGYGVNQLYAYGNTIYAWYKHDILTFDDVQTYCERLDAAKLPDGRLGYYSEPEKVPNSRVATRDDYFWIHTGCHFGNKVNSCCQAHLDYMYYAMIDKEYPIPPEILSTVQANVISGAFSSKDFIKKIIDLYKIAVIDGLELEFDVWSPVHQLVFRRAHDEDYIWYWFWDMVGHYGQTMPIAGTPPDNTSDKLLLMSMILINREKHPTAWSMKSDVYLRDKVDYNHTVKVYWINPFHSRTQIQISLGHSLLDLFY